MTMLSLQAMKRLMQRAGCERISKPAMTELAEILTTLATQITNDALEFVIHEGRKTIKARDLKIVAKRYVR